MRERIILNPYALAVLNIVSLTNRHEKFPIETTHIALELRGLIKIHTTLPANYPGRYNKPLQVTITPKGRRALKDRYVLD